MLFFYHTHIQKFSFLLSFRFIEVGPAWTSRAQPVEDALSITMQLPALETISLYNMCKGCKSDEAITIKLKDHRNLKNIYVFSCQPALVNLIRNTCKILNVNFEIRNRSNMITIEEFIANNGPD